MTQSCSPILESLRRSSALIASLAEQAERIEALAAAVVATLRAGNKILTAGHGGSAADALHMSEELVGRFVSNRRPLPAVCLAADPTLLTCIANDFGFTHLFPRQVEALGDPGDALVFFSTSGNGEGFQRSAEIAKSKQMSTIALLGKTGGPLAGRCDYELIVPDNDTARIQEAHTVVMHIILEAVERAFAPE